MQHRPLRATTLADLQFIACIVGDSRVLFSALLDRPGLPTYMALVPLYGREGTWVDVAALAFEAGHSPEDIVSATYEGLSGLIFWSTEEV